MSNVLDKITPAIDVALGDLPAGMDTQAARVMLYAIGLQESRFKHRFQVLQGRPGVKGPARGFWQFERAGGTRGVMTHAATEPHLPELKSRTVADVWESLETDDVLAAKMARLLLWSDPRPLPKRGDTIAAWHYYLRNWRPGKPHPQTWGAFFRQAEEYVYGNA